jgi:hypothetical protein
VITLLLRARTERLWNGQPWSGIHARNTPNEVADEPWSEMDHLTNELNRARTFAETASFLCRDEDEVRQKARALGLTEHPGKRIRLVR